MPVKKKKGKVKKAKAKSKAGSKARPYKTLSKKHSVLTIYTNSFVKVFKNPVVMMPIVFTLTVVIIIMAIVALTSLKFFLSAGVSAISPETFDAKTIAALIANKQFVKWLLTTIGIATLALIFTYSYFYSSLIGLSISSIKQKKVTFKQGIKQLWKYANKYWYKYLAIKIVIAIATIAYLIALIAITETIKSTILSISLLLAGIIIMFLLLVFLLLSPQALIFDETGIVQALTKSCKTVKKNYLSFLGLALLWIISFLVAIFVAALSGPFASLINLAIHFVLVPAQLISFVMFYAERK